MQIFATTEPQTTIPDQQQAEATLATTTTALTQNNNNDTNNNNINNSSVPSFASPFKGPKIAWKKQFKRSGTNNNNNNSSDASVTESNCPSNTSPTPQHTEQQQAIQEVNNTDKNELNPGSNSPPGGIIQAQQDNTTSTTVNMTLTVKQESQESTTAMNNMTTMINSRSDPATPARKSIKRKVISPCASIPSSVVTQDSSSNVAANIIVTSISENKENRVPLARVINFSSDSGASRFTMKQSPGFTSPRERKLAKRVSVNRVDTISQNLSTSKVALKFVF